MKKQEQFNKILEKDCSDITFGEFKILLECHDWTYMYSDDFRYWSSGDLTWRRISSILKLHEDDPKWDDAVGEASPFKVEKTS